MGRQSTLESAHKMSIKNKKSFWDFEQCCKYDVLTEDRHMHLISAAMRDPYTGTERLNRRDFILYGPDQALLVRTTSVVVNISLYLYDAFLSIIHRN